MGGLGEKELPGLSRMIVRGKASDHSEVFEFTVEPFVGGGFRLDIRYSGDCHHNITGAGIWPTVARRRRFRVDRNGASFTRLRC